MKKVILNVDNLDKVYQLSERATKLLFYLISVMDENNVVLLSLNEAFYKIKLSVASLHRGRVELLEKGLIIDTYTKEDRRKYYRINMVDDEKNKDIVLGALKFVINNLKD